MQISEKITSPGHLSPGSIVFPLYLYSAFFNLRNAFKYLDYPRCSTSSQGHHNTHSKRCGLKEVRTGNQISQCGGKAENNTNALS